MKFPFMYRFAPPHRKKAALPILIKQLTASYLKSLPFLKTSQLQYHGSEKLSPLELTDLQWSYTKNDCKYWLLLFYKVASLSCFSCSMFCKSYNSSLVLHRYRLSMFYITSQSVHTYNLLTKNVNPPASPISIEHLGER